MATSLFSAREIFRLSFRLFHFAGGGGLPLKLDLQGLPNHHLLIIFLHIPIRLLEQLLIIMELVLEQRLPQRLPHFAFSGSRWPAIHRKRTFRTISSISSTIRSTMMGVSGIAGFLEELSQGRFAAVFVFGRRDFLLGIDQVFRQVKQGFQEGDAVQLTRLRAVP